MKKIRQILDSITMYRVILYGLSSLATVAFVLSALNILTYSSFGVLVMTFALLSIVCFFTNVLLSKLYKVTPNFESTIITTFILFFVLAAPTKASDWVGIGFAALVAVASKYVVTWHSAHIFNPAAFGVLAVTILGIGNGAWWIADKSMFIPMILVGYLVLLKIRRFELFFAFLIPAVVLIVAKTIADSNITESIITALTLYPVLFLGSIMLTEPSTMPITRTKRIVFGALVGLIFASNIEFGFIAASPQLALIVGNLFAFAVTMRASARMVLVDKTQLTPTTYSFSFKPNRQLKHAAGQYIELTLPGVKNDARGNRRTFTIASPPSDDRIKIGVKFYDQGSQFKNKLMALKPGDEIMGNHIAGDFTLPKQKSQPVVFVAGGIGITPFISMIKDMIATKSKQAATLYYFANDKSEVAYKDVLKAARNAGIKIHLRVGNGLRLTEDEIKNNSNAQFYLSGPPGLVNGYKAQLQKLKIKNIHTDLFTGY